MYNLKKSSVGCPRLAVGIMVAGAGAVLAAGAQTSPARAAEIAGVYVDVSQIHHDEKSHGDTWDYIWADDDTIYSFNCDGRGYGTKPRNVSFNHLVGDVWNGLSGSSVNPMDYGKSNQAAPNGSNWKVTGATSVDGVIYAFIANNWYGNQNACGGKERDPYLRQTVQNMSLIKSTDKGKTWTPDAAATYEHPMWTSRKFSTAFFVKYGQNGGHTTQDEQNKYVYAISNDGFWNCGDNFYLGRAPRSKIADLNAGDWQYFSDGKWSSQVEAATPVPGLPAGQPKATMGSPIWLAGLGKYVTVTWYDPGSTLRWHYPENVTFAFYQADHPWGPWSYVGEKSADDFIGDKQQPIHRWYGPSLSPKFITNNPDGSVTAILTFSGQTWEDEPSSLYKNNSCPVTFYMTPPLKDARNYNDTDAKYSAGWSYEQNRGAGDYQDDLHISSESGAAAVFEFQGRGIEVLAEKKSGLGKIEIVLDQQSRGVVSLNQDPMPLLYQVEVFRDMNLPSGRHTLQVINRSPNTRVVLDGFRVYDGTDFSGAKRYRIVNRVTGRALAIRGSSVSTVSQASDVQGAEWSLKATGKGWYQLTESGRDVSIAGEKSGVGGAELRLTPKGSTASFWRIDDVGNGTFSIVDHETGLAISGIGRAPDRTEVVELPYFSRDLQKWEIVATQ